MTDSTGAIHARYDYDPYGRITKVSGDLEADFGFTGFYRHQASGLNLTLYRAYDANLGRWPNRDPIGENGGINLYGYVRNNPIGYIDPYGLNAAAALIILRGAVVRAGVAEAVGLGPENPAADIAATGLLILGSIEAIKALADSSKPAESQSQKKSCPANSTSSASPDPNYD
jgi:RHS repeat-associated protein